MGECGRVVGSRPCKCLTCDVHLGFGGVHAHTCARKRARTHTHASVHTHIHTHAHMHIHARTRMPCVHVHAHARTHAHPHTCTHAHTRSREKVRLTGEMERALAAIERHKAKIRDAVQLCEETPGLAPIPVELFDEEVRTHPWAPCAFAPAKACQGRGKELAPAAL